MLSTRAMLRLNTAGGGTVPILALCNNVLLLL